MRIVDFSSEHIPAALQIARQNYEEERGFVPALPAIDSLPDLTPFAENRLGAAALEGNRLIGFLCSVLPFRNAFGSTIATGVFSPMGANGAIGENRAMIYARLYQVAGDKWVRAGAASHAVCLYAHDREAQDQFFRYGFGLRCIDAIRAMDPIVMPPCEGYSFTELAPHNISAILQLENMLNDSYIESPFFMFRERINEEELLKGYARFKSMYFVAGYEDRIVAFLRTEHDGENFISGTPGYMHIKGAYCLPEHRGKGIHQTLLNMMTAKLKTQGYTRLGVDFESLNPTANGFWLKYFSDYAHSVVRRIDEKCMEKQLPS